VSGANQPSHRAHQQEQSGPDHRRTGLRRTATTPRRRQGWRAAAGLVLLAGSVIGTVGRPADVLAAGVQQVQEVGGTEAAQSANLTTDIATTSGDLIVVTATLRGVNAFASTPVEDSAGNTYTAVGTKATGTNVTGMFYAADATAVTSVTVQASAAATIAMSVQEFSGISPTAPLDVEVGGTATGTAPTSGTSAATAQSTELVVAGIGWNDQASISGQSAGYTVNPAHQSTPSAHNNVQTAYVVTSATGTESYSATLSASVFWGDILATFMTGPQQLTNSLAGCNTYATSPPTPAGACDSSIYSGEVMSSAGFPAGARQLNEVAAFWTQPAVPANPLDTWQSGWPQTMPGGVPRATPWVGLGGIAGAPLIQIGCNSFATTPPAIYCWWEDAGSTQSDTNDGLPNYIPGFTPAPGDEVYASAMYNGTTDTACAAGGGNTTFYIEDATQGTVWGPKAECTDAYSGSTADFIVEGPLNAPTDASQVLPAYGSVKMWDCGAGDEPDNYISLSSSNAVPFYMAYSASFVESEPGPVSNSTAGFSAYYETWQSYSPPNAELGANYNYPFVANGTGNTYGYSGNLPAGLSLSKAGVLSGTTSAVGSFTFTIQATDSGGAVDTPSLTVVVSNPPPPNPPSVSAVPSGDSITFSWSGGGGTAGDAINYYYVCTTLGCSQQYSAGSVDIDYACYTTASISAYVIDVAGQQSSTAATSATTQACAPPSPPSVAAAPSGDSITFSWGGGGGTGEAISYYYVCTTLGCSQQYGAGSVAIGYACYTTASISAYVVDVSGQQSSTAAASATTQACPPPAPPSVSAAPSGDSITFSWSGGGGSGEAINYYYVCTSLGCSQQYSAGAVAIGYACNTTESITAYVVDVSGQHSSTAEASATTQGCSQPPSISIGVSGYWISMTFSNFTNGGYNWGCYEDYEGNVSEVAGSTVQVTSNPDTFDNVCELNGPVNSTYWVEADGVISNAYTIPPQGY
jgi:hypothetical protein